MKRVGVGAGIAAAVLAAVAVTAGTAGADTARRPVVLVHGWLGSPANFNAMKAALEADGYPVYTVRLPGQENVANASAVGQRVATVSAQHGNAKVDLVVHSMGALSARYYLKFLGGVARVQTYVSMGSAEHGYTGACQLPENFGGQMCPGSAFLNNLNAGDDTPGPVAYTTLRSTRDEGDSHLDGGACFGTPIPDVDHAAEPRDPAFIAAVKTALNGGCPGTHADLPTD
jgi:triacylglycerol lipase